MSSEKVFMISFIHNCTLKKKVKIPAFPCNVFYSNWEKLVAFILYKECLVLKASVKVKAYWITNRMRGFRECMDKSCLTSLTTKTAEYPLSSMMSLFPEVVSEVCSVNP